MHFVNNRVVVCFLVFGMDGDVHSGYWVDFGRVLFGSIVVIFGYVPW